MKLPSSLALLLAALTLCAAPAWSADYDLKKSALNVGQSLNMESNIQLSEADMTMTLQGQSIKGTMTMHTHKVQVAKITAVNNGQPSEIETDVKEHSQKQAMNVAGRPSNNQKNEPLHGATVVSKRVGEKWENQLKSGQPSEAQTKALRKMNMFESDALYEDRKMTVGESWAVPPERMAKFMGESMAGNLTGTMQCKFERVENVGGRPCAVVTADLKVSGKSPDQPELLITMELKGTMYRSLAEKIDVQVDLAGTLKMEGPVPNPPGAKMEVSGPMTMKHTATLSK